MKEHTTNGYLYTNINKDKECEIMDSLDTKDLVKRTMLVFPLLCCFLTDKM